MCIIDKSSIHDKEIMSHYESLPKENWQAKTRELIESYPLELDEIEKIALLSWKRLWDSEIGGQISLSEVELPATVVGYFFQKLFAYELSCRYPDVWRGEENKNDKDLVNKVNAIFSTEMKASGQNKFKVFGNRSYNQETLSGQVSGKSKSGFYITINFTRQNLNLIRLGWIDQSDWIPQGSKTGQAATLKDDVYTHKMTEINGEYRYSTPVELFDGVADKTKVHLQSLDIYTFKDLFNFNGFDKGVESIKKKNKGLLSKIFGNHPERESVYGLAQVGDKTLKTLHSLSIFTIADLHIYNGNDKTVERIKAKNEDRLSSIFR